MRNNLTPGIIKGIMDTTNFLISEMRKHMRDNDCSIHPKTLLDLCEMALDSIKLNEDIKQAINRHDEAMGIVQPLMDRDRWRCDEMNRLREERDEAVARAEKAMDVIRRFGGIDGDHHKAWVIDQAFRHLAGDDYDQLVADAKDGEDGPNTYSWNVGIPP